MGDVPQDDVMYNVVIGETVTGDGDELDHYQVLQYNFKPASIDGSQEGFLRKTENGGVDVEFATPSVKTPDSRVCFKGQYTPCKEYECILIFDSINSTFRLERLMGIGKGLKVDRKDQSRPATSKMVVPLEQEYEAPPPTITPNRSRAAKTKVIEQPPAATGNSPDDGSVSEGGKRRGARKAAPAATKRARKTNPRAAKGVKQPEPAADDFDLEALAEQIESGVPQETTKSDEGEEEEDFLAAAFESENTYQPPVVEPPIPASTRPTHTPIPPHKPHPSHLPPPPAHHAQTFGFPATNQNQFQAGMLNGVHGAAPAGPSTTAEESDSGSDSESASDSSSASDSASDSSSESESENE